MQISKKGVDKKIEKRIFKALYQALADFKTPTQIENFLDDVLSETERMVLAKRLGIAYCLSRNLSYEKIREDLKVSSATIASVQKWLEQGGEGLSLALKTIEAEEWAGEMTAKIVKKVKRIFKN